MSPSITVRQYNPDSGSLLGNVSTISFGKITAGTMSKIVCLDVAFSGITEVSNIKLGLTSSGGLNVSSNASDTSTNDDGSVSRGYFGIESTASFDSSKSSSPLVKFFKGINATVTASDVNNVSVPSRSQTLSNYIYLSIQPDAASIGASSGAWKLFFDYS